MIDTKHARNTLIAVALIFVLALGAYAAGFYYVKTQVEDTSTLTQELEQKRSERENLQKTLQVVEETKGMREELDQYFVRASDMVGFIERLESLGDEAGVANSINSLEENEGALTFSMEAQGSFESVLHFTALLEHLPINMTFERVQLQQAEENAESPWEATYTGSIKSFLADDDS